MPESAGASKTVWVCLSETSVGVGVGDCVELADTSKGAVVTGATLPPLTLSV